MLWLPGNEGQSCTFARFFEISYVSFSTRLEQCFFVEKLGGNNAQSTKYEILWLLSVFELHLSLALFLRWASPLRLTVCFEVIYHVISAYKISKPEKFDLFPWTI